jgi:hypothetical protein
MAAHLRRAREISKTQRCQVQLRVETVEKPQIAQIYAKKVLCFQ